MSFLIGGMWFWLGNLFQICVREGFEPGPSVWLTLVFLACVFVTAMEARR